MNVIIDRKVIRRALRRLLEADERVSDQKLESINFLMRMRRVGKL